MRTGEIAIVLTSTCCCCGRHLVCSPTNRHARPITLSLSVYVCGCGVCVCTHTHTHTHNTHTGTQRHTRERERRRQREGLWNGSCSWQMQHLIYRLQSAAPLHYSMVTSAALTITNHSRQQYNIANDNENGLQTLHCILC